MQINLHNSISILKESQLSKTARPMGLLFLFCTLSVLLLSFTTISKEKKKHQDTPVMVHQPTTLSILDTFPKPNFRPGEEREIISAQENIRAAGDQKGMPMPKLEDLLPNAANGRSAMPKSSQRIKLKQQKKSATSTVVDFEVENNGAGNPYNVNYSYEMNKAANGDTKIELKAFLDPLDMYIEESLKFKSDGQMVTMPKDLEVGQSLGDVSGTFNITIPNVYSFNKKYEVTLSNRKIEEEGMKTVYGKTYKAYKHTYNYLNKSYFNGELDCTKYHKVTEWYIESIGLIDQERSGTNERGDRREFINNTSQF